MCIQKLSVDEIAKIFFHISSKKKYANHQFVIFLIILQHHNGISSFSCIHGKRRPSGNENGHRQSKQWLCWDHSMSLESFVSYKLNKEICQFCISQNSQTSPSKASLSFLKSMKGGGRLVKRQGIGNQSNG